jgi:nitroreductase
MEVDQAIRTRRSIRSFTDQPVTREELVSILDAARWAPSWANTQAWSVFVVRGERLARIKAGSRDKAASGAPRALEIPAPSQDWPAEYKTRTEQLLEARSRGLAPGVPAPDPSGLFGAPCLLLFAVDPRLRPEYACYDTGAFVQTLCLAAHDRGLGTCIMAMAVGYPDVVRAAVPEIGERRLVVGVALGHPAPGAAVNAFERARAPVDELVVWAD